MDGLAWPALPWLADHQGRTLKLKRFFTIHRRGSGGSPGFHRSRLPCNASEKAIGFHRLRLPSGFHRLRFPSNASDKGGVEMPGQETLPSFVLFSIGGGMQASVPGSEFANIKKRFSFKVRP